MHREVSLLEHNVSLGPFSGTSELSEFALNVILPLSYHDRMTLKLF